MNISVIIPVYNAAEFLAKAVDSVLQFSEVKEILLVEDGSKDNSLEVCHTLVEKHDRIRLIQHFDKGNHGAGATRNLGLQNVSQDFTAFLDADDYYLPNRFDVDKKIFQNNEIDGVFGAMGTEFLSAKGEKEFREKFSNAGITTVKKHAQGMEVFYGLLGVDNDFGTFFGLNTLTVRTASLRKNRLKFNESLLVHQDSDFILKLSFCCMLKSGSIDAPVAVRGVHDHNRITKIKLYSDIYNERQFLLWQSVYRWSKDKQIEKKYAEHLRLRKKSFEISLKKGVPKLAYLIFEIIRNPKILKTRYRFAYLKK